MIFIIVLKSLLNSYRVTKNHRSTMLACGIACSQLSQKEDCLADIKYNDVNIAMLIEMLYIVNGVRNIANTDNQYICCSRLVSCLLYTSDAADE